MRLSRSNIIALLLSPLIPFCFWAVFGLGAFRPRNSDRMEWASPRAARERICACYAMSAAGQTSYSISSSSTSIAGSSASCSASGKCNAMSAGEPCDFESHRRCECPDMPLSRAYCSYIQTLSDQAGQAQYYSDRKADAKKRYDLILAEAANWQKKYPWTKSLRPSEQASIGQFMGWQAYVCEQGLGDYYRSRKEKESAAAHYSNALQLFDKLPEESLSAESKGLARKALVNNLSAIQQPGKPGEPAHPYRQ